VRIFGFVGDFVDFFFKMQQILGLQIRVEGNELVMVLELMIKLNFGGEVF